MTNYQGYKALRIAAHVTPIILNIIGVVNCIRPIKQRNETNSDKGLPFSTDRRFLICTCMQ